MNIENNINEIISYINTLELDDKIEFINNLREKIHQVSPFKNEPVDFVKWVPQKIVQANDYNPNKVAPPEMKLLVHSIDNDGFTQPIVTWKENDINEVIDGFHRSKVCKESFTISARIFNCLPIVTVNDSCIDRNDRIASTIRHNRARGKHVIEGMSDIVIELKNRNWKDKRIAKELGMDEDEILRLCQITGLAGIFADQDFSKSWDIEDSEPDFIPLTEEFELEETDNFRTVNTSDKNRVFHKFTEWECYKAGFYATSFKKMKKDECEKKYGEFLSDDEIFKSGLNSVITEWKYSCEHYLTNSSMNRIAWLGQASCCYVTGLPAIYRGGFNLLSHDQQDHANKIAHIYLNKWLKNNDRNEVDLETALSGKQMDIY